MVNDSDTDALTGKALLKKVKELEHLSREEKAKTCGYYTITKSGVTRVNMMKFLNALIEAEGIQIDSTQSSNGRGGRSASYRITVQSNGNLLIGSAYTKQMGLQPGDEFEISLGRKHIRLTQLESGSDSEDADTSEES
ncbi:MAG: AbrB family transcriptional regulator [Phormidesmis sp.]